MPSRSSPNAESGTFRWSIAARFCGIVSIGDLVKYRMDRIEAEADAMRAYIQSA